jgi:hypothetical protein
MADAGRSADRRILHQFDQFVQFPGLTPHFNPAIHQYG